MLVYFYREEIELMSTGQERRFFFKMNPCPFVYHRSIILPNCLVHCSLFLYRTLLALIVCVFIRTTKRAQTLYDGQETSPAGVCHIPMAEPFCKRTREVSP